MGLVGVSDLLIYASDARADTARSLLAQACRATNTSARLEVYGTGSLYQRLGPRRAPPTPDLVWWFGPFAARAAALDSLLQAYQPSRVADGAARDPNWNWTAIEYSAVGTVVGTMGALPRPAGPTSRACRDWPWPTRSAQKLG